MLCSVEIPRRPALLKGNGEGVNLGKREGGRDRQRWRKEKLQLGCVVLEKNKIKIKNKKERKKGISLNMLEKIISL